MIDICTVVLLSTLHGLTENRNISKTVRNITNPMSFSSLTNKGKAEKAWNTFLQGMSIFTRSSSQL